MHLCFVGYVLRLFEALHFSSAHKTAYVNRVVQKVSQIKSNQIKFFSSKTAVRPLLYNTRQDRTILQSITVTKQHSNYKVTISEMRNTRA